MLTGGWRGEGNEQDPEVTRESREEKIRGADILTEDRHMADEKKKISGQNNMSGWQQATTDWSVTSNEVVQSGRCVTTRDLLTKRG